MNYITGHIPLKCAISRNWTPAEVLCLRGKIGTLDNELGRVVIEMNEKRFYLYPDECIRIPDVGEDINDRHVVCVYNIDEESMFERRPIIVAYVQDERILAEELKEFWRTL